MGCASICAFYSAVGVLFTLWVGVMISKQPFFIAGVIEDADTMEANAWGAMIMFICTFALSLYSMYSEGSKEDVEGMEPVGAEGYQLTTGGNDYGTRYD